MSKQEEVEATCLNCGCTLKASLYRSIWGEHAENREIVFNDTINVMVCPNCGTRIHARFALLYVDMDRQFAVWYEPEPDPVVDRDTRMYAAVFGPECFYATAPRISDWEAFKQTILRFERGELRAKPILSARPTDAVDAVTGARAKSQQSCLLPLEMSPVPCHACGIDVALAETRCPNCSANLLVVGCPACGAITPRDAVRCISCNRTLPAAYCNLSDAETRELFSVELMLRFNATSDQVAPDQRENFIRLWGLYKRRLLHEITDDEFKRGQIDSARNMTKARAATERKTGCTPVIVVAVASMLSVWAVVVALVDWIMSTSV